MIDFRHFDPPTIDTFAKVYLRRSRRKMRQALRAARYNGVGAAWCAYGEADAAVGVLYDINHERAYGAAVSLARVRHALAKALKNF